MKKINQEDLEFFYCYSYYVATELQKYGFKPIAVCKHIKTDNIYSIFLRDDDLTDKLGLIMHKIKWTNED